MRRGWGTRFHAVGVPPRALALVITRTLAKPKADSALLGAMTRPFVRLSALVAAGVLLSACADKGPVFSDLAHEFVYNTLATSPSAATQAGLHIYPQGHDTLFLDALLDDFSPASRDAQVKYYRGFQERLKLVSRDKLDAQTQADYDLVSAVAEGRCSRSSASASPSVGRRCTPRYWGARCSPTSVSSTPTPRLVPRSSRRAWRGRRSSSRPRSRISRRPTRSTAPWPSKR